MKVSTKVSFVLWPAVARALSEPDYRVSRINGLAIETKSKNRGWVYRTEPIDRNAWQLKAFRNGEYDSDIAWYSVRSTLRGIQVAHLKEGEIYARFGVAAKVIESNQVDRAVVSIKMFSNRLTAAERLLNELVQQLENEFTWVPDISADGETTRMLVMMRMIHNVLDNETISYGQSITRIQQVLNEHVCPT